MVHDFWNRVKYHRVLPFVEELARVDTLAVFRRPSSLNLEAIVKLCSAVEFESD
jgi:hypothetical protein